MILASHNSWTYLPPKKWWMRLFNFVAKCQTHNIEKQYDKGARMFDLRIRFDNHGYSTIAHGLAEYSTKGLDNELMFLNQKNDVCVRVILEVNKDCYGDELLFINYCTKIKEKFRNISFFGGNRKYDWKQLFDFEGKEPEIKGLFASVVGGMWNDLWPWMWAKRNNKEITKRYSSYEGYVMMDFV